MKVRSKEELHDQSSKELCSQKNKKGITQSKLKK